MTWYLYKQIMTIVSIGEYMGDILEVFPLDCSEDVCQKDESSWMLRPIIPWLLY